MPRTNGDEVKQIIDTDLTASQIDPFVAIATIMVNSISGLDDDLMKEIERWLAAHYVAIRDPRLGKTKTGESEDTYAIRVGMGLDATTYGQQAKDLDTTGTLAALGKKKIIFKVY